MDLGRLIKIFTAPKDYWNEVVGEPGDIKTLLIPQMLLLAAIPAVALFVGQLLTYMRFGLSGRLFAATFAGLILQYGLNIGLWILMGVIINALAEPFGAQKDFSQAMKLATGATIPTWLGGALNIVPVGALGMVGGLAGLGYGAYFLYLGLPVMNGTPQDKAVGYVAATIGIMFVASIIVALMAGCPIGCMMATAFIRP